MATIINSDAPILSAPGSKFVKSSERSVSSQLVSKLRDPENIIGDPSQIKINKFQNLQISDFDETEMEVAEWETFANVLTAFGFAKRFSKEKQIILPNLKIYLSSSDKETEKSNFVSIAVLDDPTE